MLEPPSECGRTGNYAALLQNVFVSERSELEFNVTCKTLSLYYRSVFMIKRNLLHTNEAYSIWSFLTNHRNNTRRIYFYELSHNFISLSMEHFSCYCIVSLKFTSKIQ